MSFGKLEYDLIRVLRNGKPDFQAAKELIDQGANVNAHDDDENILSEILLGYWQTAHNYTACDNCNDDNCDNCKHNETVNLNPNLGESMCKIIKFFLENGFDVNKDEGRYGAQCLMSLALSSFDRYIIEATKLLFDAGAKNIPTTIDGGEHDTPLDSIVAEESYQGTCEHNHALCNVYEAVYQIYEAVENNLPYNGIDTYEIAIGKKILKVLAEKNDNKPPIHGIYTSKFKRNNCFKTKLYFVYDSGALITTEYADFWIDTYLPNTTLVDVSNRFPGIVNSTITDIIFSHREVRDYTTTYGQPITILEMDSGIKLKFSINFGEVDNDDRAAYFQIIT